MNTEIKEEGPQEISEPTKTDITEETLLAAGWVKTDDPAVKFEKALDNLNPINNGEDSDIKLIIHGYYNYWAFAFLLPDGGMLNFVANSMAELADIERRVTFYDPPF
jgi:hypothetical protein